MGAWRRDYCVTRLGVGINNVSFPRVVCVSMHVGEKSREEDQISTLSWVEDERAKCSLIIPIFFYSSCYQSYRGENSILTTLDPLLSLESALSFQIWCVKCSIWYDIAIKKGNIDLNIQYCINTIYVQWKNMTLSRVWKPFFTFSAVSFGCICCILLQVPNAPPAYEKVSSGQLPPPYSP